MPADMKEAIAQAARTLLTTQHVKKLTVKDLVEQCHITRQTFYYHFADIPELFRWMLERQTEQMLREIQSRGDPEEGLRYFFAMASQLAPHIQRGMDSSRCCASPSSGFSSCWLKTGSITRSAAWPK